MSTCILKVPRSLNPGTMNWHGSHRNKLGTGLETASSKQNKDIKQNQLQKGYSFRLHAKITRRLAVKSNIMTHGSTFFCVCWFVEIKSFLEMSFFFLVVLQIVSIVVKSLLW